MNEIISRWVFFYLYEGKLFKMVFSCYNLFLCFENVFSSQHVQVFMLFNTAIKNYAWIELKFCHIHYEIAYYNKNDFIFLNVQLSLWNINHLFFLFRFFSKDKMFVSYYCAFWFSFSVCCQKMQAKIINFHPENVYTLKD